MTFYQRMDQDYENGLPEFVKKEFDEFLKCGVLAHGFHMRLKRVFRIDVDICSECGGKLKVISSIEEKEVIDKILTHLGLDSKVTEPFAPRGPPEKEEDFFFS